MTKYNWHNKSLGLLLLCSLITVNAVRVQQAGKLVRGKWINWKNEIAKERKWHKMKLKRDQCKREYL